MLDFLLNINWRQPLWFFLVLFPILLWLILVWLKTHKQNSFADKHLLPWIEVKEKKTALGIFFSRNSAYFLSWFLFSLALAGPRIPDKLAKDQNQILMDIMLVVDLSRSMQATDIKPSRIRRATLEAFDLLSIVKNARVGIIVYAGRAHLYVPLTSDLKALRFYLSGLDLLQLPTHGGDANAALLLAEKELLSLAQKKLDKKQQIILWMTDGDIESNNLSAISSVDNQSQQLSQLDSTLMTISNANISTYILGLGTEEGAAIPLADGSWLESEGQAIISKMNVKQLEKFSRVGRSALVTNERFMTVTSDNSDWDILYSQGMMKSLKTNHSANSQQWIELFAWVLFPAILFLVVALFPLNYSFENARKNTRKNAFKKSLNSFVLGLILFFVVLIDIVSINSPLYANEYMSNSYDVSLSKGIEAYKQNDFIKAKRHFINSVLSAEATSNDANNSENKARAIALHNLGNTLFQLGDYATAATLFTDALRYAPKQNKSIKNQKLSIALFIEMEKRRKRKMNRGNSATADDIAPVFDLPEQLPYMLSTKAIMLLKASLPKLPKEKLDQLLGVELSKLDLLQNDDKLLAHKFSKDSQQKQLDMQQARLYLMDKKEQTFDKSANSLWKRLFEIEEGFPGKLKEPKTIPGVSPW